MSPTRRHFFRQGLLASAALALPWNAFALTDRKFRVSLNPGMVGIQGSQAEMITLAKKHGFEAVAPALNELIQMTPDGRAYLVDQLSNAGLTWDSAGLPIEFRQDKARYQRDLLALPKAAAVMA